jgi:hypothetical protein
MINVEHTIRTYSGRPGCQCGCRGNYNESERARKMALKALLADSRVRMNVWHSNSDVDRGCLFLTTDTRQRVVYLTSAGVAQAISMGVQVEQ